MLQNKLFFVTEDDLTAFQEFNYAPISFPPHLWYEQKQRVILQLSLSSNNYWKMEGRQKAMERGETQIKTRIEMDGWWLNEAQKHIPQQIHVHCNPVIMDTYAKCLFTHTVQVHRDPVMMNPDKSNSML